MKITQGASRLILIFSLISIYSFGQDTLYVKLNNRHIPKVATKSISLHNFKISSDTIYEIKGVKMSREKRLILEQLQRKNFSYFLTTKTRKSLLVTGLWKRFTVI